MTGHRFQDIWKEQCEAARSVRDQHSVVSALDYLIGEKLLNFAEAAVTRPEFARELPRFVAEVRNIFSAEEIRRYLDHLERMAAFEDEQASAEDRQRNSDHHRLPNPSKGWQHSGLRIAVCRWRRGEPWHLAAVDCEPAFSTRIRLIPVVGSDSPRAFY